MESGSGSEYLRNYLDFDLEIGEGTGRKYSVVVRSPAGEAQEEMSFPFNDRELRNKLRDLEVALVRSGGTRRRISPEEQTVRDFGKRMFEALLVGDVRTRYLMSLDEAAQQDKGLRLKLRVKSPQLAVLPWEFLYDPDYGDYLCLSSDTPIVRYVDLRRPVRRLTLAPPLKVLGMVASPRGLDPLNVDYEKELVDEAIEGLRADGLVELTWLEGQTWRHLQRAMRHGPWHVFHFIGHGDFDPEAEEGVIALRDEETGRAHLLESRDLARLLDGHRYLRLVLLNSCEGARGSEGDPFSGTAATLVRRGVPAVVAMQYEITDRAAIEFSRAFYEATADGWPVDAAVGAGRTAVSVSLRNTLEWGTPVLYMRSPDGRLFDISAEARKPQRTQEITEDRERDDALRQYRERVVRAWVDGALHERDSQRLKEFRSDVGLNASTAARVEREVMGETIEGVLERQEQAAREKERKERLDRLYARAQRSYQDRQWQAVIDVFAQIHLQDPAYPDPEGLLTSARQALDKAAEEQNAYHQYREAVQSAWADEELDRHEVETLRDLADKLEVSPRDTASIDREIMGDTKEAIVESQERAAKDRYRRAVGEAWIENKVDYEEADRLGALRSELGLSADAAADIEREVTGDTVQAILQRQIRQEEERQHHVDQLYAQARQLHGNGQWQAVVNVFEQIHAVEPRYPDPEGLLEVAHKALERLRRIAALYDQGRQHMDAGKWHQALECFEEVERLESGYRDVETLLAEVRHELAPPPTEEVPDLSGQELRQAKNILTSKGLIVLGAVVGIVLMVAVALVLLSRPGVPPYTVEERELTKDTQEFDAESLVVSTSATSTQELGEIALTIAREDLAKVAFQTPEGAPIADAWVITTQEGYDNIGKSLPSDADPVGKEMPYVYVRHSSEE